MRVSVGICTHNGERYIAEQLKSILAQTVKPDEIVLGDDCSSDSTVQIATDILRSGGVPYRIMTYSCHQGILKNFKQALDACTGDVIFSCDQDDVWMPDKIESFLPHFEEGCNFVYSNAVVVDAERNILEKDFWAHYGIRFSELTMDQFEYIVLTNSCIAGCNMAFTKELYDAVAPIPHHYLHDGWLAICAPWFGTKKIGFIDKPLIEYRIHGKNTSGFSVDRKITKTDMAGADVKKPSVLEQKMQQYLDIKPDRWFGNQHYFATSGIFLERMGDVLTPEYREKVNRFHQFAGSLLTCLPSHRWYSCGILLREYINGNYREFRGNARRLIRDWMYLLLNRNTTFEHDKEAW